MPAPRPAALPAPILAAEQPLSHTEAFYAARLELPLRQFGYDTFQVMPGAAPADGDGHLVVAGAPGRA
jgi:hypothetical protein